MEVDLATVEPSVGAGTAGGRKGREGSFVSRRPRVALIGPMSPFRGGIAHHTDSVRRALNRCAEVLPISFSRQYPRWLFPGESDREPEDCAEVDGTCRFLIDSLNPVSWETAFRTVRRFRPDFVLIPWWTAFWGPCFWFLALRCEYAGISLKFMCHNVVDHEGAAWKRMVARMVLARAKSCIVQSRAQARSLTQLVPGARISVHPHPVYDKFPPVEDPLPRRADLELLFFGFVRPYKGLDILIEAVASARERKSLHLSVVGEFWNGPAHTDRRIRELGIEDVVEVVPRYVADKEAAAYFSRADAIVLPYLSATGSGVLSLAYHYRKPVIATAVEGIEENVDPGRTGLLVPAGSAADLAKAIEDFSADGAIDMLPHIDRIVKNATWESLCKVILED